MKPQRILPYGGTADEQRRKNGQQGGQCCADQQGFQSAACKEIVGRKNRGAAECFIIGGVSIHRKNHPFVSQRGWFGFVLFIQFQHKKQENISF